MLPQTASRVATFLPSFAFAFSESGDGDGGDGLSILV